MRSATLANPVTIEGRGLFSGQACTLLLEPASSPLTFICYGAEIAVHPANFSESPNCTVLSSNGSEVRVTEHLMAALWAAGIDHARLTLTGPEVPNQDGSAHMLYEAIAAGGRRTLEARPPISADTPSIELSDNGASLSWVYDEQLSLNYEFSHDELGQQSFTAKPITREFAAVEILPARSFITEREAQSAIAAGILHNRHAEDALVIRGGVPDRRLRYPDEYARHKVLDLLGDLYVMPLELSGSITAKGSGHKLNRELARRLWELNS